LLSISSSFYSLLSALLGKLLICSFQSTVAWKLVGILFFGKSKVSASQKSVSQSQGTLFSVSPGSNLSLRLSPSMKFHGDLRGKLNEFARVLRYFQVADLSGHFL
jgi:hypothetical protein